MKILISIIGFATLSLLLISVGSVVMNKHHSKPATLSDTTTAPVTASTTPLKFEVVTTASEQSKGLSGRKVIPDNYGMLFVFDKPDSYGFWMKDMLTSIDIIWLSDTGTVLKVDGSVSPQTYPAVLYPPAPVKFVLETRAGYAREHDLKKGTPIELPLPYGKTISH